MLAKATTCPATIHCYFTNQVYTVAFVFAQKRIQSWSQGFQKKCGKYEVTNTVTNGEIQHFRNPTIVCLNPPPHPPTLKVAACLPSDPKFSMTLQFPEKSYHGCFPDSRLQNKGKEKKTKKMNLCFQEADPLNSKLKHSLLLLVLSLLEPLMQSNLCANFLGRL